MPTLYGEDGIDTGGALFDVPALRDLSTEPNPVPGSVWEKLASIKVGIPTLEDFGGKQDSGATDNRPAFAAALATGLPVLLRPSINDSFYGVNGPIADTPIAGLMLGCVGGIARVKNTAARTDAAGEPGSIGNGIAKIEDGFVTLHNVMLEGNHDGSSVPGDNGYPVKGVVINAIRSAVVMSGYCSFGYGIEYGLRLQQCYGQIETVRGEYSGFQGTALVAGIEPLKINTLIGNNNGRHGFDIELSITYNTGIKNLVVDSVFAYDNGRSGFSASLGTHDSTALLAAGLTRDDFSFSVGRIVTHNNSEANVRIDFPNYSIESIFSDTTATLHGVHLRNAFDSYSARGKIGRIESYRAAGAGVYLQGSVTNNDAEIDIGEIISTDNTAQGLFIASSDWQAHCYIGKVTAKRNGAGDLNTTYSLTGDLLIGEINADTSGQIVYEKTRVARMPLSNNGTTNSVVRVVKGRAIKRVYVVITSPDPSPSARFVIKQFDGALTTNELADIKMDVAGTRVIDLSGNTLQPADTDTANLDYIETQGAFIQADPQGTWTPGASAGVLFVEFI